MDANTAHRELRLTADVVASICGLPAVATQDWCEQAGRALLPIRPAAFVCVCVAEVTRAGELLMLEDAGVINGWTGGGPIDSALVHAPGDDRFGWWLPALADPAEDRRCAVAIMHQNPEMASWQRSRPGRRWAELAIADLLVGAMRLDGRAPDRYLVVEIGVRAADDPLEPHHAEILEAVMPELAHRALLALGSEPVASVNRITPREQLILEQLTLGKTVKQIAESLSRSPHTVHDHVKSLHRKLNASSRGELIARALGHIETGTRRTQRAAHLREPTPEVRTRAGFLRTA